MQNTKLKVLYIAGFERSGSTIINRVLGQIEGFIAWGELRDIWQHGVIENRPCTCGKLFSDCPAWQKIFDRAFGGVKSVDAVKMFKLQKKIRNSYLPYCLGLMPERSFQDNSKEYFANLNHLYHAIQSTTKRRVIVDSTKAAWYGSILGMMPEIDLYVVHVVRHPQGVCHSLQKRKLKGEVECQWYNPIHASTTWNLKNLAVERLLGNHSQPYIRMKYEDFVEQPQAAIQTLLNFVREPTAKLPFKEDGTVEMNLDHIITGSPSSRFQTGSVRLSLDESWKREMKAIDKIIVKTITYPLGNKYGY